MHPHKRDLLEWIVEELVVEELVFEGWAVEVKVLVTYWANVLL